MGRKVKLENLTNNEQVTILKVIQRDFALRKKEEDRLEKLKEVVPLQARENDPSKCVVCGSLFLWLLNQQVQCTVCQNFFCKSKTDCGINNDEETPSTSICHHCSFEREVHLMSLEWFYSQLKNKFRRHGGAKILREFYRNRKPGENLPRTVTTQDGESELSTEMTETDGQNTRLRNEIENAIAAIFLPELEKITVKSAQTKKEDATEEIRVIKDLLEKFLCQASQSSLADQSDEDLVRRYLKDHKQDVAERILHEITKCTENTSTSFCAEGSVVKVDDVENKVHHIGQVYETPKWPAARKDTQKARPSEKQEAIDENSFDDDSEDMKQKIYSNVAEVMQDALLKLDVVRPKDPIPRFMLDSSDEEDEREKIKPKSIQCRRQHAAVTKEVHPNAYKMHKSVNDNVIVSSSDSEDYDYGEFLDQHTTQETCRPIDTRSAMTNENNVEKKLSPLSDVIHESTSSVPNEVDESTSSNLNPTVDSTVDRLIVIQHEYEKSLELETATSDREIVSSLYNSVSVDIDPELLVISGEKNKQRMEECIKNSVENSFNNDVSSTSSSESNNKEAASVTAFSTDRIDGLTSAVSKVLISDRAEEEFTEQREADNHDKKCKDDNKSVLVPLDHAINHKSSCGDSTFDEAKMTSNEIAESDFDLSLMQSASNNIAPNHELVDYSAEGEVHGNHVTRISSSSESSNEENRIFNVSTEEIRRSKKSLSSSSSSSSEDSRDYIHLSPAEFPTITSVFDSHEDSSTFANDDFQHSSTTSELIEDEAVASNTVCANIEQSEKQVVNMTDRTYENSIATTISELSLTLGDGKTTSCSHGGANDLPIINEHFDHEHNDLQEVEANRQNCDTLLLEYHDYDGNKSSSSKSSDEEEIVTDTPACSEIIPLSSDDDNVQLEQFQGKVHTNSSVSSKSSEDVEDVMQFNTANDMHKATLNSEIADGADEELNNSMSRDTPAKENCHETPSVSFDSDSVASFEMRTTANHVKVYQHVSENPASFSSNFECVKLLEEAASIAQLVVPEHEKHQGEYLPMKESSDREYTPSYSSSESSGEIASNRNVAADEITDSTTELAANENLSVEPLPCKSPNQLKNKFAEVSSSFSSASNAVISAELPDKDVSLDELAMTTCALNTKRNTLCSSISSSSSESMNKEKISFIPDHELTKPTTGLQMYEGETDVMSAEGVTSVGIHKTSSISSDSGSMISFDTRPGEELQIEAKEKSEPDILPDERLSEADNICSSSSSESGKQQETSITAPNLRKIKTPIKGLEITENICDNPIPVENSAYGSAESIQQKEPIQQQAMQEVETGSHQFPIKKFSNHVTVDSSSSSESSDDGEENIFDVSEDEVTKTKTDWKTTGRGFEVPFSSEQLDQLNNTFTRDLSFFSSDSDVGALAEVPTTNQPLEVLEDEREHDSLPTTRFRGDKVKCSSSSESSDEEATIRKIILHNKTTNPAKHIDFVKTIRQEVDGTTGKGMSSGSFDHNNITSDQLVTSVDPNITEEEKQDVPIREFDNHKAMNTFSLSNPSDNGEKNSSIHDDEIIIIEQSADFEMTSKVLNVIEPKEILTHSESPASSSSDSDRITSIKTISGDEQQVVQKDKEEQNSLPFLGIKNVGVVRTLSSSESSEEGETTTDMRTPAKDNAIIEHSYEDPIMFRCAEHIEYCYVNEMQTHSSDDGSGKEALDTFKGCKKISDLLSMEVSNNHNMTHFSSLESNNEEERIHGIPHDEVIEPAVENIKEKSPPYKTSEYGRKHSRITSSSSSDSEDVVIAEVAATDKEEKVREDKKSSTESSDSEKTSHSISIDESSISVKNVLEPKWGSKNSTNFPQTLSDVQENIKPSASSLSDYCGAIGFEERIDSPVAAKSESEGSSLKMRSTKDILHSPDSSDDERSYNLTHAEISVQEKDWTMVENEYDEAMSFSSRHYPEYDDVSVTSSTVFNLNYDEPLQVAESSKSAKGKDTSILNMPLVKKDEGDDVTFSSSCSATSDENKKDEGMPVVAIPTAKAKFRPKVRSLKSMEENDESLSQRKSIDELVQELQLAGLDGEKTRFTRSSLIASPTKIYPSYYVSQSGKRKSAPPTRHSSVQEMDFDTLGFTVDPANYKKREKLSREVSLTSLIVSDNESACDPLSPRSEITNPLSPAVLASIPSVAQRRSLFEERNFGPTSDKISQSQKAIPVHKKESLCSSSPFKFITPADDNTSVFVCDYEYNPTPTPPTAIAEVNELDNETKIPEEDCETAVEREASSPAAEEYLTVTRHRSSSQKSNKSDSNVDSIVDTALQLMETRQAVTKKRTSSKSSSISSSRSLSDRRDSSSSSSENESEVTSISPAWDQSKEGELHDTPVAAPRSEITSPSSSTSSSDDESEEQTHPSSSTSSSDDESEEQTHAVMKGGRSDDIPVTPVAAPRNKPTLQTVTPSEDAEEREEEVVETPADNSADKANLIRNQNTYEDVFLRFIKAPREEGKIEENSTQEELSHDIEGLTEKEDDVRSYASTDIDSSSESSGDEIEGKTVENEDLSNDTSGLSEEQLDCAGANHRPTPDSSAPISKHGQSIETDVDCNHNYPTDSSYSKTCEISPLTENRHSSLNENAPTSSLDGSAPDRETSTMHSPEVDFVTQEVKNGTAEVKTEDQRTPFVLQI